MFGKFSEKPPDTHLLPIVNQFKKKLPNKVHSKITFTFKGTRVYQNAY